MIWMSDAGGSTTYVSAELASLFGRSATDLMGLGWLEVLHPDDRSITEHTLLSACKAQIPFSMRYRAKLSNGSYSWAAAGAFPSFGPPERTFLGFLGSLAIISPSETEDTAAFGSVGRFQMPAQHSPSHYSSDLDCLADHLLQARSAALDGNISETIPSIDLALTLVGRRLASQLQVQVSSNILN